MYLAFRVLRFPDLSVDNVFAMGGLVAASAAYGGLNPIFAALLVLVAGFLVGIVTSTLFTLGGLSKLLSGLITYSVLFSVNLRVFGKPNVSFVSWPHLVPWTGPLAGLLSLAFVAVLLSSTLGKALIAYGENSKLTEELGIDSRLLVAIGLGLATSLVCLSGFAVSQSFGFADVGLGVGTLLHGIAGILVGTAVFGATSTTGRLLAITLGLFLYNSLLYVAMLSMSQSFRATDIKLVSSALVVLAVVAMKSSREELGGL
jgi:putative ABC transport system permease protein